MFTFKNFLQFNMCKYAMHILDANVFVLLLLWIL